MFTCLAMPTMFACEDSFEELFLSPSCVIRRWKPGHQVWKHVPLLLSHISCPVFFYYTAVATETPSPTKEDTLKYTPATGDRQDFEDMQRARPHDQPCLSLYPGLLCS